MDWFKVLFVVAVLLLVVGALGTIASLNTGSSSGQSALTGLTQPVRDTASVEATWSPVDVGRKLVPELFSSIGGYGLTFDFWGVVRGAFASLVIVVGVAILIRLLSRVVG